MTTTDSATTEELRKRIEELERQLRENNNRAVSSGKAIEDKIQKKLDQIESDKRRYIMGGDEDEEYHFFGKKWVVYANRKNLLPKSIADSIEELRRIKKAAERFEENATLDAAMRRGPRDKEEVIGEYGGENSSV